MVQATALKPASRGTREKALVAALLFAAASTFAYAWFGLPRVHPEAAQYSEIAAIRLTLAERFRSYDSVEQLTAALAQARLTWTHRSNTRPPSYDYPPRALDTLTVADYRHLGEPGVLTLEFFNDRLFEVQFEPQNPESYARKLHAREPDLRRDRNGRAERVAGPLRFATNADFAASFVGQSLTVEPYAIWQDLRLVKERNDWDAKYGGIPYSAP